MIYVFVRLPKALDGSDLIKSFNSFSLAPEIAKRLVQINGLRDNFYKTVANVESKGINQVVSEIDVFPMIEYLSAGPDLIEFAVKNANYPLSFKFSSVLNPSKEIVINDGSFFSQKTTKSPQRSRSSSAGIHSLSRSSNLLLVTSAN
jgi:hypothetical protein